MNTQSFFYDGGSYQISYHRLSHFKTLDFHSHDSFEFYIFIDGSVTYYVEDKMYSPVMGDVLVIPPGYMHRPVISDENAVNERFVININPSELTAISTGDCDFTAALRNFCGNHLVRFDDETHALATRILYEILKEAQTDEFGRNVIIKNYVTMLITLISRETAHGGCNGSDSGSGIIPKVIVYINEHLTEPLSIDTVAGNFFISRYHLIREFKKYTNSTMYDYIISKRITLAKKLMMKGDSITEAAQKAGFSEYSSFYRGFVHKTGISPKAFLMMH